MMLKRSVKLPGVKKIIAVVRELDFRYNKINFVFYLT